jgi:hypothetical protein
MPRAHDTPGGARLKPPILAARGRLLARTAGGAERARRKVWRTCQRTFTRTPSLRAGSNTQRRTASSTAASRTGPADSTTATSCGRPFSSTVRLNVTVPSRFLCRARSG